MYTEMPSTIWFLKLPQDFVERFQRWVKLRNILAHEYLDIEWKRISDFIQNSQEYFQALLEDAKGYLNNIIHFGIDAINNLGAKGE